MLRQPARPRRDHVPYTSAATPDANSSRRTTAHTRDPHLSIDDRLNQLERSNEELMGLVTALTAVTTALAATHPNRSVLLDALARAAPGVREATQANGVPKRTQLVLEAFTNMLHQTLTEPVPSQYDEAQQVIRSVLQKPPQHDDPSD